MTQSKVVLFMKGNPEVPRCGFSRKIVGILKSQGVQFSSFDILSDESVRSGGYFDSLSILSLSCWVSSQRAAGDLRGSSVLHECGRVFCNAPSSLDPGEKYSSLLSPIVALWQRLLTNAAMTRCGII